MGGLYVKLSEKIVHLAVWCSSNRESQSSFDI